MAREPRPSGDSGSLPALASLFEAGRGWLGKRRGAPESASDAGSPPPDAAAPAEAQPTAPAGPSRVRVHPERGARSGPRVAAAPRPVRRDLPDDLALPRASRSRAWPWAITGGVAALGAVAWLSGRSPADAGRAAFAPPPEVELPAAATQALADARATFRRDTLAGYRQAERAFEAARGAGGGTVAEAGRLEARAWGARLSGTAPQAADVIAGRALVEREPGSTAARRAWATTLLFTGRAEPARQQLVAALDRAPEDAGLYLLLALHAERAGNAPAVSLSHLRRAAELDPGSVAVHAELARFYGRSGLRAEARAERARVLAASPDHRMRLTTR